MSEVEVEKFWQARWSLRQKTYKWRRFPLDEATSSEAESLQVNHRVRSVGHDKFKEQKW